MDLSNNKRTGGVYRDSELGQHVAPDIRFLAKEVR